MARCACKVVAIVSDRWEAQSHRQKPLARRGGSPGVRTALVALACLMAAFPGCLGGAFGSNDAAGPRDYVSSAKYGKWAIELDTVPGKAAPAASLALLEQRLEEVVSKPGGVRIEPGGSLAPRGGTWSQKDLLDTSARERDLHTGGDTATIHLLIVDGNYEDNNVLGVTFLQRARNGNVVSSGPVVLFADVIRRTACPPPLDLCIVPEQSIWSAVLVHEFGHAMGLVNVGAPMQRDHEDDAHPGHSTNDNSVMYFEVETVNVVNAFQGGPPTTFDADDKADLCALGGQC